MILISWCKQNLSPGVAVMLSSPSAVRQVDGIDDSWEAQYEPGMDQLTEEKWIKYLLEFKPYCTELPAQDSGGDSCHLRFGLQAWQGFV